MFTKKDMKKDITLGGVAYIRAINTPEHFNRIQQEAKDIFKDAKSKAYAINQLTGKDREAKKEEFNKENYDPMKPFLDRVMLNLGKNEFLECKIDFNLKENQTLIHDIVTEITIKDGIVTKITIPNLKYAYGD